MSSGALPCVDSAPLHHSEVVDFKGVLSSIATTDHRVPISLEVNRVSANVRSINRMNWASVAHVVDKEIVVPAA